MIGSVGKEFLTCSCTFNMRDVGMEWGHIHCEQEGVFRQGGEIWQFHERVSVGGDVGYKGVRVVVDKL